MNQKPECKIDEALVRRLIAAQFPQWKNLSIKPVAVGGWDNRTFHLGEDMLVRMPSAEIYASQVEKEYQWLPKLAPLLPLPIPEPLAIGLPGNGYPWKWSINRWLEGESAAVAPIADLCDFAASLAQFLVSLHRIDITGGPAAGAHSFYRGGSISIYDNETRDAIAVVKNKIDAEVITEIWETALESSWQTSPVWVHGDISVGNLLLKEGKLCAVIDFGQLAVGDPACDLAIAWTLFKDRSREVFRLALQLDPNTWARGRAWALWKSLIVAAGLTNSNAIEASEPWRIINEIVADYKRSA